MQRMLRGSWGSGRLSKGQGAGVMKHQLSTIAVGTLLAQWIARKQSRFQVPPTGPAVFGSLKGVSESVQVLLHGVQAVVVLTSMVF